MRLRFADFEFDCESKELLKGGSRIPIQEKPLQLLSMLLANSGRLVTRQDIVDEIWADAHVSEDQSLNTAIRKVRLALNDSATTPKFVETVGSRGYRFVHPVETATAESANRTLTVAVLPLENLGDEADEHLSEGLTEDMISRLGRLRPRFKVIALSSVLRYKQQANQSSDILRELGADYFLSGSIRRSGSRVRISARMVSAADHSCLWSRTFERELSDVFAVQQEVAENVARSSARVLSAKTERAPNSTAHEIYLRGRYFWNKQSGQGLLKSIELYNRALAEDPDYALCYAGIADSYLVLVQHGVLAGAHAFPIVRDAALKALSLDEDSAEVHTSLAWVKAVHERDMAGAEAECRTALEINPSYSFAYMAYAFVLTALRRHAEALDYMRRGMQIDPVSLPMNAIYASLLYFARDYESAVEQCEECLDLESTFALAHAVYGQTLEAMGEYEKATERFQKHASLAPWSPFSLAHLARNAAFRKMQIEAYEYLDRLFADAGHRYVPPYFIAQVYAALEKHDSAFEWLARAERDRSNWIILLAVDPKFDALRHDPRFPGLLKTLGLRA